MSNILRFPPIVGISGIAHSGKSTAAEYLRTLGYGGDHINTPMVDMARVLLRYMAIPEAEIEDRLVGARKNEPLPGFPHLTGRTILQKIGKDLRDALGVPGDVPDETFFLELWAQRNAHFDALINESVRYPVEGAYIEGKGGLIIRLTVPGLVPPNDHISELIVVPFHVEIINLRRDVAELHGLIDHAIDLWAEGKFDAWNGKPILLAPMDYLESLAA